jgi:hypothetical protein
MTVTGIDGDGTGMVGNGDGGQRQGRVWVGGDIWFG